MHIRFTTIVSCVSVGIIAEISNLFFFVTLQKHRSIELEKENQMFLFHQQDGIVSTAIIRLKL